MLPAERRELEAPYPAETAGKPAENWRGHTGLIRAAQAEKDRVVNADPRFAPERERTAGKRAKTTLAGVSVGSDERFIPWRLYRQNKVPVLSFQDGPALFSERLFEPNRLGKLAMIVPAVFLLLSEAEVLAGTIPACVPDKSRIGLYLREPLPAKSRSSLSGDRL